MKRTYHTKEQVAFLENKKMELFKHSPHHKELFDKLEEEENTLVVASYDTPKTVKKILEKNTDFSVSKVTLKRGQPSSCHSNSASLSARNENYHIATGYALSKDGLWRQHTWVVQQNQAKGWNIIETTEKRVKYFGYILDEEEREEFIYENL